MGEFFQIIGSIASLIGIPLAIYLYLKSKEAKFDRLKKEIVKVLSYQIGDERLLTNFEIRTVINSVLRENRIKTDSITISEIVEDLVSEVMASPLINKDRKTQILNELKKIYLKGEIFDQIDQLDSEQETSWDNLEAKLKSLVADKNEVNEKISEAQSKADRYRAKLSTTFAFTAAFITVATVVVGFINKDKFWSELIPDDEELILFEIIIPLLAGVATSIMGVIVASFIRKKRKE